MAEKMIERVADAICLAANKFRKESGAAADYAKRAYEAEARAAIEAMREPTEEMQRAGFLANVFENPIPNCCDNPMRFSRATIPADKPYQAMIDAALNEAK